MSGNETTWELDKGLRLIAEERFQEPMSSWPEHNEYHKRTILGSRLDDSECLRCHLEVVNADHVKKKRKKERRKKRLK